MGQQHGTTTWDNVMFSADELFREARWQQSSSFGFYTRITPQRRVHLQPYIKTYRQRYTKVFDTAGT